MILFSGLRRNEVEKLDWSAVNFRTGHVEVSAEVSKVARERYAPITDNLREWLRPLARKDGPCGNQNLIRPIARPAIGVHLHHMNSVLLDSHTPTWAPAFARLESSPYKPRRGVRVQSDQAADRRQVVDHFVSFLWR
jgi:integrase